MSSKKLKTIPIPAMWHRFPWKDFLPGVLPEDWSPVLNPDYTAYERADGLRVIVTSNRERDGKMWLHVSYSRADRVLDYNDTVEVKRRFCGDFRYAIAVFPPKSKWINDHPNCLHLWSALEGFPLPDFRVETSSGRMTI